MLRRAHFGGLTEASHMLRRFFSAALTVALLVTSARAQEPGDDPTDSFSGIYVEFYSINNPGDGWAHVPGFPDRHANENGLSSGSNITISNANTVPYRVFAVEPTTDIGSITFSSTTVTTQLMVGAGATAVSTTQLPIAGCRHIGAITGAGVLKLRLQVRVTGTASGAI
jgi:hypothetical protein